MKQTILIFGSISIVIFLLFQLSQYSVGTFENWQSEFFILFAAVVFILIGYYINRLFYKSRKNRSGTLKDSNLSKQEFKILTLMNEGRSNGEIAEGLFIAESTVKKHVSNILSKLKAKRRTEAIKIAKDLEII